MVLLTDYQQQEEAALYSSLCLLEAQGAEGAKQIEFSKNMFRSKNNKALELVLYHCYSVVKSKPAAKKLFNRVWPISDKDTQQRKEFYKRAEAWLKESGQLEAHGNSLQPFVRNPFGPKMVSLLCDVTHWALSVQHERLYPSDTIAHSDLEDNSLLLALAEPLVTAAKAQNQLEVDRMLSISHAGAQLQQQAVEKAQRLRDLFYSFTAQLKETRAACETTLPPEVLFSLLEGTVAQGQGMGLGTHDPPQPQLPVQLLEQQQELQQLWARLEGHVQEFDSLAALVQGLAGSDVHPHAIDGAALRAAGHLPGAPSTAGLDIAAMMEAWLEDVGVVCRTIRSLAGQPDDDRVSGTDLQPHGTWGSAGGSAAAAGARGSVCPLVATSDASSHAPHLYAQLGLHQNCLDHMRGMKSAISLQMAAAGERIQQLEVEVFGLMAAQLEQCEKAGAMESADAASQNNALRISGVQPGVGREQHAEHGAAVAISKSSLFSSGSLQLVPPTPMLQQLLQRQQHGAASKHPQQQQQMHSGANATAAGPVADDQELLPGRLSFGGDGALIEPASSGGSPPVPPAAVAGVVDSPRLQRACSSSSSLDRACDSPGSSVSSRSLPAAALLMSQDIMDLDLVDLGDVDDLFVARSPAVRRAVDPMQLSVLRLSVRNDGLAASMAAAARAVAAATDEHDGSRAALQQQHARGGSPAGFSLPGLGQLAAGQTGDDTPPHVGHAAAAPAAAADTTAAAAEAQETSCEPEDKDDDSMLMGSAVAAAGMEAGVAAAAAHDEELCSAAAATLPAAAADGDGVSPLVIEAAYLDAMGPVPGSDMSSAARPRRLTFAAAVCADSPSLLQGYSPAMSSPCSSGGSVAPGCDSAASSEQRPTIVPQEQVAGHADALLLLKQRFAKLATG